MKKTYITPALQVDEAQVQNLMAVSLQINTTEVDGSAALSKEEGDWDIWDN